MSNKRDYTDKQYKKFRTKVIEKARGKCQRCGKRRKLYSHHIKKWSNYPELRYDPNNGVGLCYKCHKEITGDEESFVQLFKIKQLSKKNKLQYILDKFNL